MNTNDALPLVRADIEAQFLEYGEDGSPYWTLYDPVKNGFFKIGFLEHEILKRWSFGSKSAIVQSVNQETTLSVNIKTIDDFIEFLFNSELLVIGGDAFLNERFQSMQQGVIRQLVFKYLFFRVPLIRPNKLLAKTLPYVKCFFSYKTICCLLFILLIAVFLLTREWYAFAMSWNGLFSIKKLVLLFIAIFIAKSFHELGHAYCARYYGCHVGTMGVAFLVMFPVLYTDVTDAWRLSNRKKRIMIALSGMLTELSVAIIALFVWTLSPPGAFRDVLCYLVTVSAINTLLINLNPILKFDGYYVLSDILSIDNLQAKAYQLGIWRMREFLFGFKENKPWLFDKKREKIIIVYAYFSWVYRFVLFLSIAVLVYFMFFKVLGIVLMIVEVAYFIIMPFVSELSNCYQLSKSKGFITRRTMLTLSVLGILIVILFIPWQTRFDIPAQVEFAERQQFYAPFKGKISHLQILNDSYTKEHSLLITIDSPEIDYQMKQVREDIAILQLKMKQEVGREANDEINLSTHQELLEKENALNHLRGKLKNGHIKASFSGVIAEKAKDLHLGAWVQKGQYLFTLVNDKRIKIIGFLSERELYRAKRLSKATFYGNNIDLKPIQGIVTRINSSVVKPLILPYQASLLGGKLNAIRSKEDNHQLQLKDAYYRVVVSVPKLTNTELYEQRGTLELEGKRTSIAIYLFKYIASVFIRESGF